MADRLSARLMRARRRPARTLPGREARDADPVRADERRRATDERRDGRPGRRHSALRALAKGSLRPAENDSRFLLDLHRRACRPPRMARYRDAYEVDLVIWRRRRGRTLAQRLARRGWRVVVLETGPFWDPDRDWVSDEAGSSKLYWTEAR